MTVASGPEIAPKQGSETITDDIDNYIVIMTI